PVDEQEPRADRPAPDRLVDVVLRVRPPPPEGCQPRPPDQDRLVRREPRQGQGVPPLGPHPRPPPQGGGPATRRAPPPLPGNSLSNQPVAGGRGRDLVDVATAVRHRTGDLLHHLSRRPPAPPHQLAVFGHLDELLLATQDERRCLTPVGVAITSCHS